jgi:hypothetical protein
MMEINREETGDLEPKKDKPRFVGRPLKFKTPKALQEVVSKYFEETPHAEWTVTGLALVVGSKQLIQDYEARDGYSEIIKRAKLMVEHSYELALKKNKNSTGAIFALKNMDWKDKTEVDNNISGDSIMSHIAKRIGMNEPAKKDSKGK